MEEYMKKLVKIFIVVSLFLIGISVDSKISAKSETEDLENLVDKFFKIQQEYSYEKKDRIGNDYKMAGYSETDKLKDLFSSFKIRDKSLEDYFLNYIKLNRIISSKSNIEEEVISEEINKTIEEDEDNIILFVNRIKESIFTIDGIRSDEVSSESAKYKFIFDKASHELIDYIPIDVEEQTLMKADMEEVIRNEVELRDEENILKEEIKHQPVVNEDMSPLAYSTYSFNRVKMTDYAINYAYNYNPNYGDFTNYGGDCTNFVSQIIRAGNAPLDTTGSYQWYYYNMSNRAPAWSSANRLFNYLINNDYIGPQGRLANSTDISYNMQGGDPVFIDFDGDNVIDHSVSITGYQIGAPHLTKVTAHTVDRRNYPLSNYKGYKKYVRLTGYGSN